MSDRKGFGAAAEATPELCSRLELAGQDEHHLCREHAKVEDNKCVGTGVGNDLTSPGSVYGAHPMT